jgi:ABC-2 type transport system ATP-binding protein
MRRRLDLAATLVSNPEVLFLDEPTTGLDPRARAELWEVLDTLVGRGTTLLLTTQYLEEAERLANDIIVLDHGHIIAQGDSRELKRQVGGDQIQVVVVDPQQIDLVSRIVSKVAETEPTIDLAGRAVIAPTTNGVDTLVRVATELRDSKIEVDDISMRQPTLDEVFLTLTGSDTGSDSDDSSRQNEKGR